MLPPILFSYAALSHNHKNQFQIYKNLLLIKTKCRSTPQCREDMEAALVAVSPETDCQLWVERYHDHEGLEGHYDYEDHEDHEGGEDEDCDVDEEKGDMYIWGKDRIMNFVSNEWCTTPIVFNSIPKIISTTPSRYKTGNVPPGEYHFEDLSSSNTLSSTSSASSSAKTRTLSRVKSPETGAWYIYTVIKSAICIASLFCRQKDHSYQY